MLFLDKKLIVYNVYNYLFPEVNPLKQKHKVNTLVKKKKSDTKLKKKKKKKKKLKK